MALCALRHIALMAKFAVVHGEVRRVDIETVAGPGGVLRFHLGAKLEKGEIRIDNLVVDEFVAVEASQMLRLQNELRAAIVNASNQLV